MSLYDALAKVEAKPEEVEAFQKEKGCESCVHNRQNYCAMSGQSFKFLDEVKKWCQFVQDPLKGSGRA